MTADITRLFRDPEKRYHGLVRQQGRVPVDAEENHGTDIAQWTDEQRFVETIAPSGSPDDGFKIALIGGPGSTNFTILAGSYYLDGSRIGNPGDLAYRRQWERNWLSFPIDAEGTQEAIGPARQFLVWLDVREAVVTATEDSELLEPGIGPDGAARKRFGWHVRATPVVGPGCAPAATQWLAAQNWTGLVAPETGLLASGATLTIGFNPAEVDQDLCQPSLTPGFLGARNECYRLQVTRSGRYVWGQDDAAPLYRVRVEDIAGQPRRIVFLDMPRDEYVRPRAGHTVELLRWDEILPNGQKTAEAMGAFYTVSGGYEDGAITVSTDVDAAWRTWLNTLPGTLLSVHDDPLEQRYFYLRVWTGGGQGGQPDIPFATVNLTGTGLTVAFTGAPLPGDHWVIAARPNAPTRLMPWRLLTGMAAHGPRRHVVPLAFVDLDAGTVTDCRRRFRPLYKIGGCCTVTVGDGVSSWGDVSTIAAAVARLPAAGGEICLGPGIWAENIILSGRANITFTGCGARTRWIAGNPAAPLLQIRNCEGIRVRRLQMEGGAAQCILADLPPGAPAAQRNRDLQLEELILLAPSGSAVSARFLEGMKLRLSTVEVGPFPTAAPPAATSGLAAIYLQGEDLLVERNVIAAPLAPGQLPSQRPLGGVHIGGDSRDVVLLRNRIEEGNGNGVTLGSVTILHIDAPAWTRGPESALANAIRQAEGSATGFYSYIDAAGCIHIGWIDPLPQDRPGGTVDVPVSDGVVSRVRIEKNFVSGMGGSGIATFPMFVTLASGEAAVDAVAVENLLALDNEIIGCMAIETPTIPPIQYLFSGFGGIALGMAMDCTIRDNQIADTGAARREGTCGIFIGYGEDIRIERNRIENNGSAIAGGESAAPAGGIFVRIATGGISTFGPGGGERRTRDRPALWIQNNVVHAPFARALRALALGPAHVTDNRLSGSNPSLFFAQPFFAFLILLFGGRSAAELLADPSAELDIGNLVLLNLILEIMGGDAVNLVNLGIAEEMTLPYTLGRLIKGADAGETWDNSRSASETWAATAPSAAPMLRGGETLFANNQVSLHRSAEASQATLSSVMIMTRDDLCFADNQLEIEADLLFALFDAVLFGTTLRAVSNRVQESALCVFSLATWALGLNTTADNQTTFMVNATANNPDPTKLVDRDNLTAF